MLDIAAFPIAVALTLWDAIPIYLSVALALSILVHVLPSRQAPHRLWLSRERLGVEGAVYLFIIEPSLAPLLAAASAVSLAAMPSTSQASRVVLRPAEALVARAGELVFPLLVASMTAALIKLATPLLPASTGMQCLVAIAAGLVTGHRSGAVAIPATAIAVHYGGFVPAALCIVAATVRPLLARLVPYLPGFTAQRL